MKGTLKLTQFYPCTPYALVVGLLLEFCLLAGSKKLLIRDLGCWSCCVWFCYQTVIFKIVFVLKTFSSKYNYNKQAVKLRVAKMCCWGETSPWDCSEHVTAELWGHKRRNTVEDIQKNSISSNIKVLCVLWVLDQHSPALCVPAKAAFGSIATNSTIKFHICVGFHFSFL